MQIHSHFIEAMSIWGFGYLQGAWESVALEGQGMAAFTLISNTRKSLSNPQAPSDWKYQDTDAWCINSQLLKCGALVRTPRDCSEGLRRFLFQDTFLPSIFCLLFIILSSAGYFLKGLYSWNIAASRQADGILVEWGSSQCKGWAPKSWTGGGTNTERLVY